MIWKYYLKVWIEFLWHACCKEWIMVKLMFHWAIRWVKWSWWWRITCIIWEEMCLWWFLPLFRVTPRWFRCMACSCIMIYDTTSVANLTFCITFTTWLMVSQASSTRLLFLWLFWISSHVLSLYSWLILGSLVLISRLNISLLGEKPVTVCGVLLYAVTYLATSSSTFCPAA